MGEDITKLKKNIEAIKRVMQGSKENESKKSAPETTIKAK